MKSATAIRSTKLPSGEEVPVLGLGTWHLAEGRRRRQDEIKALRLGLDLGMNLIDTAEMYADGEAEELVGEAIAGRRESVFLVTKVLPHHATRQGTIAACEHSLKRLKTDWIDLYLLHWREEIPLSETVEGFQELIDSERIRYWGVSNFDVSDMAELFEIEGGANVTTDQVLYNITRRGIEFDLVPWCRERNIPIMAYSPIEQGRLVLHLSFGTSQNNTRPLPPKWRLPGCFARMESSRSRNRELWSMCVKIAPPSTCSLADVIST